jgi:hypothetical protein
MWPAYAPTGAGWGDAVTGISRADSASENATTLRHQFLRCNVSGRLGRSNVECGVSPLRPAQRPENSWPVQEAFPPPRESCESADCAAVDKRSRSKVLPGQISAVIVRPRLVWPPASLPAVNWGLVFALQSWHSESAGKFAGGQPSS